jgi:hypothetical protein
MFLVFLVHERTRKFFCRAGFMALCVLPTTAVALWTAGRSSDFYRRACEEELSRVLGLEVAIGQVENLQPGLVRYWHFVLRDPAGGAEIIRAESIDVRTSTTATTIASARVIVSPNAAPRLSEVVRRRLQERVRGLPVRLALDEVVVASGRGEATLVDVRARLEPTSQGQGARLEFRTAAMAKDARPAVLTMVRTDETVGLELESRGAFSDATGSFIPALQLLRGLVSAPPALVPVNLEAQELLDVRL